MKVKELIQKLNKYDKEKRSCNKIWAKPKG